MPEFIRSWFETFRNYWTGSTGGGSGFGSGPEGRSRGVESQVPSTTRLFPNNNHAGLNNNNIFGFGRKRKRSPEHDDPSMLRTKVDEKAEYKKLVESMQNGCHQNGGSGYSVSKIPRLVQANGFTHTMSRVAQLPKPVTHNIASAYFNYTNTKAVPPRPMPKALIKKRECHDYIKSLFSKWDTSVEEVAEVQEANQATVRTVQDISSTFNARTRSQHQQTLFKATPSSSSKCLGNKSQRRASLFSTGSPSTSLARSRRSGRPEPEVIHLNGDDGVEVISPRPKIFTSTPTDQRSLAFSSGHGAEAGCSYTPSPSLSEPRPEAGRSDYREPIIVESEDDPDIQVLSESIISPKKNRYQVNSLELETRQSIYKQKTWLVNSFAELRENRRQREEQIGLEKKKIHILKSESVLPNDIEARIRNSLTITDIIVLEPEDSTPVLPPITPEMRQVINHATYGREAEVIVTAFNIQITRGDFRTLAPCQWLNDNVINTYMDMIALRSKNGVGKFPKVHVFTTFFYPKLLKEGYSNILKRWTRKVDIFSMDLIIFPIHLGIHWCLAVADLRKKSIKFYDSLLGQQMRCLEALLSYLTSELKERKKEALNRSEWSLEVMKKIPAQENGSDCGVFTCKFAEYLSRDAKLSFTQKDMNYYRERMIYEIAKQDLLYP